MANPQKKRKLMALIESEIEEGVYVPNSCVECRGSSRAGRCWRCLAEELLDLPGPTPRFIKDRLEVIYLERNPPRD